MLQNQGLAHHHDKEKHEHNKNKHNKNATIGSIKYSIFI